VYGKTKEEGERRLAAVMPGACIIRTSWLFGKGGKNFFSSIIEQMKTREEVQIVADQVGKPTYVPDLVEVLREALNWSGIYHVTNAEETSRLHFTESIYDEALAQGMELRTKKILPISSGELFTAAPRPVYSVLDTGKVESQRGVRLRSWREGMRELCSVS
jgi:dTDP-4-dehydrorhamnose reductase